MNATSPGSATAREACCTAIIIVHVLVEVGPEALGGLVRTVSGWAERNCLGGTSEAIAHGMDCPLKFSGSHAGLVLDDDIVTWLSGALEGLVRLQVQVEGILAVAGDVTIDNEARSWVVRTTPSSGIRVLQSGWVESGMMSLATDLEFRQLIIPVSEKGLDLQ